MNSSGKKKYFNLNKVLRIARKIIVTLFLLIVIVPFILLIPYFKVHVINILNSNISKYSGLEIKINDIHYRPPLKLVLNSITYSGRLSQGYINKLMVQPIQLSLRNSSIGFKMEISDADIMLSSLSFKKDTNYKQSAKTPKQNWNLTGTIYIDNTHFSWLNADSLILADIAIGNAELKNICFETGKKRITGDAIRLNDICVSVQVTDSSEDTSTTQRSPWYFDIKKTELNNGYFDLHMYQNNFLYCNVEKLKLINAETNLFTQKIEVKGIEVDGAEYADLFPFTEKLAITTKVTKTPKSESDWVVHLINGNLKNIFISHQTGNETSNPTKFSPSKFTSRIENIGIIDAKMDSLGFAGTVNQINATLNNYIAVNNGEIKISENCNEIALSALVNSSKIDVSVFSELNIYKLNNWQYPSQLKLQATMKNCATYLLTYFIDLPDSLPVKLPKFFNFNVNGQITDQKLQIKEFSLQVPQLADISITGTVNQFLDIDQYIATLNYQCKLILKNLPEYLNEVELPKNLSQLKTLNISGSAMGNFKKTNITGQLKAHQLSTNFSANYNLVDSSFRAELSHLNFNANSFLNMPIAINGSKINLEGNMGWKTDCNYKIQLQNLNFMNKSYSDIKLAGKYTDGDILGNFTSNDSNFVTNLKYNVNLNNGISVSMDGPLSFIYFDSEIESNISTELFSNFQLTTDTNLTISILACKSSIKINDNNFIIGDIDLNIVSKENGILAKFNSQPLQILLSTPLSLTKYQKWLSKTDIKKQLDTLGIAEFLGTLPNSNLNFSVAPDSLIAFWLRRYGLKIGSTELSIAMNTGKSDSIKLRINKPEYYNNTADLITASVLLKNNKLKFEGNIFNVFNTEIHLAQLTASGEIQKNKINALIQSKNKANILGLYFPIEAEKNKNQIKFTCPTDTVIIYSKHWSTNPGNTVVLQNGILDTCNIQFKNGESSVQLLKNQNCGITLAIEHINLNRLSAFLPENIQLSGDFSSNTCITKFKPLNLESTISINELMFDNDNFGNIKIGSSIQSVDTVNYNYSIDISKNNLNWLSFSGTGPFSTLKSNPYHAQMNDIDLSIFGKLLDEQVKKLEGYISGELLHNPLNKKQPLIGELKYRNLSFTPTALNTNLGFTDNTLVINNKTLYFDKIKILDENKKELEINGEINLSKKNDPQIAMTIKGDSLMLMNIADNKKSNFFGKIYSSNVLELTGSLNQPKISLELGLLQGTEISYRLTENLAANQGQGIIEFTSYDNAIVPSKTTLASLSKEKMKSMVVDAQVSIDPKTKMGIVYEGNLLFDVNLEGSGTLHYVSKADGSVDMTGDYVVNGGKIFLKLRGITSYDFYISPNSTVSWDGNHENPRLNISAYYRVKGSYISPVNMQTIKVDCDVLFTLKDRLKNPKINFAIKTDDQYLNTTLKAMPPEEQFKQALNLLIMGTLSTSETSLSQTNYVTSQINKILSDKLTQAASSKIKGVDVSFDINSYTEYNSDQSLQRTDFAYNVSKEVNERTTVKVGGYVSSTENNNTQAPSRMIGDVSLEYKLAKKENLYAKVFTDYEYQGILEGEIQRTGVGLIYRKNFRSMGNIWEERRNKKNRKRAKKIE